MRSSLNIGGDTAFNMGKRTFEERLTIKTIGEFDTLKLVGLRPGEFIGQIGLIFI
jgi:hypothetical protein